MSINIIWVLAVLGMWKAAELIGEIILAIAEENQKTEERNKKFLFRNDL